MERKVARAQGEYRADEKEALNAKVDQLEKLLGVTDAEERMLKKQLKKVNDDYRWESSLSALMTVGGHHTCLPWWL